jgi:2,5-furandicarboxylate decarboxylase 1
VTVTFAGLRGFIAYMEERGDLLRVTDEVDPYLEIGSAIRSTSDRSGPVLLFERVKGHDMPVVGGVFGSRRLCYATLGCTRETRIAHYLDRVSAPLPVTRVATAPCQEIVLTGDQVDLRTLPIPTYNVLDGGPYLTMGICISRSIVDGARNASMYRLLLKGPNRVTINLGPQQHTAAFLRQAEKRGEPLPVAFAFGVDPLIAYGSQASAGYGVDELTMAGGLRGESVQVVRCKTVDLEVPADAEFVLEGHFVPGERDREGPFGEYPGYYSDEETAMRPVIQVTAITRRADAIFHAGLTGAPMTENHVLKELPLEVGMYQDLRRVSANVVDVHYPESGANGFLGIVSMKPEWRQESRNVLAAMLGSRRRGKYNIVVDDDVDIFDMDKVLLAVSTRTRPAEDIVILPNVSAVGLDPAAPDRVNAAVGIDATVPVGVKFSTPVRTAPWPKLDALLEGWVPPAR